MKSLLSFLRAKEIGTLRKVDIPVFPFKKCSEIYKRFPLVDSTVLCAGEEGRDTCQGDSGAPLVVKEGAPICNYQIAGITSLGAGVCGSKPAIYTKVQAYLPWIEETVWK
ncbi:Serine protease snake [Gryllus bimaculatus]|nr:Serine protease snake [Gryllus bimaculatus]